MRLTRARAKAGHTNIARSIGITLILALAATMLPIVAATPAQAAELSLTVNEWSANPETGLVSYDLDLNGECAPSSCTWNLNAYYVNGSTEKTQIGLAVGTEYGGSSPPTPFTRHFEDSRVLPEITHLKVVMASPGGVSSSTPLIPVHALYPEGSIQLQVNQWSADATNGTVTYDLDAIIKGAGQEKGPCQYQCTWEVTAYYKNGADEIRQATLGNARLYGPAWTRTLDLQATDRPLGEVTHLIATLTPDYCCYDSSSSGWIQVATPYAPGTAELVVNQWEANADTGRVSYDLDLHVAGAGQVRGACEYDCFWQVKAYYKNGTTEIQQAVLGQGTMYGKVWSFTKELQATAVELGEITHVRATVSPNWCCGRDSLDSGYDLVHAPLPPGYVELGINHWTRDSSNALQFDLDMAIVGAGHVGGACEGECFWTVDIRYTDGTVGGELANGRLYGRTWSFSGNIANSKTGVPAVNAIRARVIPNDSSDLTYTTGWLPVNDFILADIDVTNLEGFLATNITLDELCITVEERARELRIPDATPATSPHAATEACLSASSVRAALIAIAGIVGGAAVVGAIIHHYIGDDPNADSIAKVAALPEPESAGSGIRPPTSCLSDAQKTSILDELRLKGWEQTHHASTINNIRYWTPLMEASLAEYEWADQNLDGEWNRIDMLHRGNHPPAYHFWVYRNLERALRTSSNWDEFRAKWDEWVMDIIDQDNTIIRWEWWRC